MIVSSDFTHYGPRFAYLPFPHDDFIAEKLKVLDEGATREILAGDPAGFLDYRRRTGITVCGYMPIVLLLEILPAGTRGDRIAYNTSGRITGNHRHSVSYVTLAFFNASLWEERTEAPPSSTQQR